MLDLEKICGAEEEGDTEGKSDRRSGGWAGPGARAASHSLCFTTTAVL